MKSICIVTSTRADYGILTPLIRLCHQSRDVELRLVVTGTHLSDRFGRTEQEILHDGFPIDARIPILEDSDSSAAMARAMARMLEQFSAYLEHRRPDLAVVLGDRYEIFAAAAALVSARIPIAHLHGGELTEGAIDDCFRHSITKMSYLHFASTEEYRQRIIRMGEAPERVFAYGALGVENACKVPPLSREELSASVGFDFDQPFAIATFHPVTLEPEGVKQQCEAVFHAMARYEGQLTYLVTKSNADAGGQWINDWIDSFVAAHADRFTAVTSLGMRRYLSALRYASAVIGNSSSGIIEVPSFHIPTVNIGDRQRGRTQAATVINCPAEENAVLEAIRLSQQPETAAHCLAAKNPYEGQDTAQHIFSKLLETLERGPVDLKKKFYEGEIPAL